MTNCAYCGRTDGAPLTDEHVIPRSIGGGTTPTNPLKLVKRVCATCNSRCGLFVDRPYEIFHMTQMIRASTLREFRPIRPEDAAVLQGLGRLPRADVDPLVCDFYFSGNGDRVYHFHEEWDEDRLPPVVGPPNPTIELGLNIALVYLRPGPLEDIVAGLRGCKRQLGAPEIVLVNHEGRLSPGLRHVQPADKPLIDAVESLGQELNLRPRIGLANDHRWMCKVALGLGHLFLNDSFATSKDASTLRQALWTIDDNERHRLWPYNHSEFRTGKLLELPTLDGCHTIHLLPQEMGIYGSVNIYGSHELGTLVSTDRMHMPSNFPRGLTLIVSHSLRRAVGPISFYEFLDWAAGRGHPEMDALAADMAALRRQVPPGPGTSDSKS